jgi:very-short-patch-repair endonuclease
MTEPRRAVLGYEGDHHRTDRKQFNRDIARYEAVTTDLGWIIIRVTGEDVPGGILRRVAAAWSRRTCSEAENLT